MANKINSPATEARDRMWWVLHSDRQERSRQKTIDKINNQSFVDDICAMTPEKGVEMITKLNEGPVEDRRNFAQRIDRVFLATDVKKPEMFQVAILMLKTVLKDDYLDE
ncbi:hypothetical protein KBC75_04125 [Candidatus Shapirobacteria bacterium]|nr:hypothetical protein [Candidatus Shapirobacteria bacterium]